MTTADGPFIVRFPASDPRRRWSYVHFEYGHHFSVVEEWAATEYESVEAARAAVDVMLTYPVNAGDKARRLRQACAISGSGIHPLYPTTTGD